MKTCYKCKQEKPLTEFRQYKSGKNKGYYQSYCKGCENVWEKEHKELYPWYKTRQSIMSRLKAKNGKNYEKYKHTKDFLSIKDLKFLWFRDKAYLLKRPSIDRINSKGNYELSNCHYIELSENSRQGGKQRRKP